MLSFREEHPHLLLPTHRTGVIEQSKDVVGVVDGVTQRVRFKNPCC